MQQEQIDLSKIEKINFSHSKNEKSSVRKARLSSSFHIHKDNQNNSTSHPNNNIIDSIADYHNKTQESIVDKSKNSNTTIIK